MASPTPPILSALIIEALKRSGYSNPSSDLQARARDQWIAEIKAEIWARARNLKPLQSKAIKVLTKGLGIYSNPSDYAADMRLVFATGARNGTAQGGSSTSVTLAATDSGTSSDTVGRELVIVSGTGLGAMATITAFDSSTKVATFTYQITPTADPTAGSGYMVLDYYKPLFEDPIWNRDRFTSPVEAGEPIAFYPIGDSTNGQFVLHPVPSRSDSQPMIVIQRYQADLTEADVSGTLMATLYQKWQPLWMSGLRWKCLQNDDDARAVSAFQEYQKSLKDICNAEIYGNTLSEMQMQVVDY